MEMTGGEAAVRALEALGVRHVFGIVSVHNLPLFDAVRGSDRIELVAMRHEQGAVHAADGYARATGGLGVAITSTGPGAANAMGGLFEADTASSRVLMLTGQVETSAYGKGRGALHEAERQVDMLRTVCRSVVHVRSHDEIGPAVLDVAADILRGRGRPGAIEIPIDLQHRRGDVDVPAPRTSATPAPDPAAIERIAAELAGASRPLLWAGGGVVAARAHAELTALAERLQAPVLTSIEGRGSIPEDHPLAVGPNTDLGATDELIAAADVVLAVGTRFRQDNTVHSALTIPGKLLHVDIDQGVLGRVHAPAVGVVADAKEALAALLDAAGHGAPAPDEWRAQAAAVRARIDGEIRQQIGPDHARMLDCIRRELPRDGVVVKDVTIAAYLWGNRLLATYEPGTAIRPTSMAIGPGLPLAIGAAVGTGRPTVVIHGDGGIMLTIGELASAVQQRVPLVVVVLNDGGYGILRYIQDAALGGRRTGVDLATPDFAALARSMGMAGERVEDAARFEELFAKAVASGEPWLLDVDITKMAPLTIVPQKPLSSRFS